MAGPDEGAGSPFWRFSLATYRKPGVAEACLALQDGFSVDVNVLLFVMWLGTGGRRLDDVETQFVIDQAAGWAREIVVPLRGVRRRLKEDAPLVDAAAAQAFRTQVKRLELEAERLQQEALYRLADRLPPGGGSPPADAVGANVEALGRALGQDFPAAQAALLVAAALPDTA
ncbi:TIGR02444 family protein [Rhodoplanes roseus]|uniref:TIGR02444 family protein n=1 Tax=Rhodoplanes roseus TaxID=29409 RepID=A0A327L303_9BRAD|nr:TIGR02444 family protein [Rhodoplanes roseus]RAI44193.1 TIGR02444 family protein [Rhodoplanes roseus]